MVAYTQNELASATEISKQFGEYISKVKNGVVKKIGILKNNKLDPLQNNQFSCKITKNQKEERKKHVEYFKSDEK